MTIREFINTVTLGLDSVSHDTYISGEYIYNIGISYATLFTKRESDSRKIFKNTAVFKSLGCIELKEVSVSSCGYNLSCNTIMRSVNKLPKAYISAYGSLILLFNEGRNKNYNEISPVNYQSLTKQKFKPKNGYYWIEDDYLFLPGTEVEQITGLILSSDVVAAGAVSGTVGCSILDEEFPVLDYLLIAVIESTIKHLLTAKNIGRDEITNLSEKR